MSDNTVRGLLAEDEAPQRIRLERLLKEIWPELDLVAGCASGTEAQQAVRALRPQVAFLDIRMPGVSGLDVARDVVAGGGHVAFITGYDQYAVDAFATNAVDYLLKPWTRRAWPKPSGACASVCHRGGRLIWKGWWTRCGRRCSRRPKTTFAGSAPP